MPKNAHTHVNDTAFQIKVSLSMRITESILTVILVSSRYENQFLSLSYEVNVAISVKFSESKPLHFFFVQIKKQKQKKKIDLPTLPVFRPKKLFFFLGLMSDKSNAENYTKIALKFFSAAFPFVILIFRVAVIFQCHFQRQIFIVSEHLLYANVWTKLYTNTTYNQMGGVGERQMQNTYSYSISNSYTPLVENWRGGSVNFQMHLPLG